MQSTGSWQRYLTLEPAGYTRTALRAHHPGCGQRLQFGIMGGHTNRAIIQKKVPDHFTNIVRNYLCDRKIVYGETKEIVNLTSGVPQSSVLGPLLWGIMYDGLFTEKMPEGVTVVGFADDVAIVGRSWRVDHLEDIVNESLCLVHRWMSDHQLKLATHKTEAVMLTRKKGYRRPTFVVGGHQISTKNSLKYLGVEIDFGRQFKVHE